MSKNQKFWKFLAINYVKLLLNLFDLETLSDSKIEEISLICVKMRELTIFLIFKFFACYEQFLFF